MAILEQTPFQIKRFDDISRGMNVSNRPENLKDGEFINVKNLYYKNDRLVIDSGYKLFQEAVTATPRVPFQFFKKNGSSELVLITNGSIYTETNNSWHYISNGTSTTISSNELAGQTVLSVTDETGFTTGKAIGIGLNDGSQWKSTIASTAAGTITIDDPLPSDADAGNVVVEAVELSGDNDKQISVVVMAAFDYMIFTNGVDNPQYYDGVSCQTLPNLPGSGNTQCTALALFENHLLLLNTTEGGTAYPQRVRWSDTADITEWAAGNAGYNDLYDSEDFLVTGVALGPYMILYRERSLVRMEFVNVTDRLFNFDTIISGEGALSIDSVVDIGTEHIFMGNSNIYKYNGGFDIEPIADSIYDKIFGLSGELNPSYTNRVMCVYIEELDEVWIFYPTASYHDPRDLLRYKIATNAWIHRQFPIGITGYGFHQSNTSIKWSELVGSWLDQTFKWGGVSSLANSPTTLLCTTGQVYEYDYVTSADNGTAISWVLETTDIHHDVNFRTDWLSIRARGGTILIEYSTDSGYSWNLWKNQTLSADYADYRIHKQVVTDRIRFRLSGTAEGFGFARYGLRIRAESIQ